MDKKFRASRILRLTDCDPVANGGSDLFDIRMARALIDDLSKDCRRHENVTK